jgi:hypothetical protein
MGQKGVVFTTILTVKDCANTFRGVGDSIRGGGMAKLLDAGATAAGHRDRTGYYTPTFDTPFASGGAPDYAIGINVLKFSAGAQGNGTHVHMYVDDKGDRRDVQLVSKHGLTDGGRSAKLTRRFLEQFQITDRQLRITDGNL